MDEGVVERYFTHLTGRQWSALAEVLAPDVVRIGPYGDTVTGRERYLDLLKGTVPSEYANHVHRIVYAQQNRWAFARVTEHLRYADQELHLEEAYAFALDAHGLLERVEIFWQTPQFDPGGFGSATASDSFASSGGVEPDAARLGQRGSVPPEMA